MYHDLIKFPLQHENLKWETSESLLDVDNIPHLFLRIKLTGTEFPLAAQDPQVWVGETFARHVLISEDRRSVCAYFDITPPEGREIYFGHFGRAELQFGAFKPTTLQRLDRLRLPRNAVLYEIRE